MSTPDLSFITPIRFRKNISDSLRFSGFLYISAKSIEMEYGDDIVRTIILYNTAIIEALLLFRYKKKKLKHQLVEYRDVYTLPNSYQSKNKIIVLALKHTTKKKEERLWLNELLLVQKDFLSESLLNNIKFLQDTRNTLHLSKKRVNNLTIKNADKSFDVLYEVITKVEKDL